jgi:hypothetical protein
MFLGRCQAESVEVETTILGDGFRFHPTGYPLVLAHPLSLQGTGGGDKG